MNIMKGDAYQIVKNNIITQFIDLLYGLNANIKTFY